jgi:hypothetical protein
VAGSCGYGDEPSGSDATELLTFTALQECVLTILVITNNITSIIVIYTGLYGRAYIYIQNRYYLHLNIERCPCS